MTVKQEIYEKLKNTNRAMSAVELTEVGDFGERTYVSKLLGQLVDEGKVKSIQNGRNVYYEVIDMNILVDEDVVLSGLDEEIFWNKLRESGDFLSGLSEQAENALYFGFTEMLNNAIDHSKSGVGHIKIWREKGVVKFIVRDRGIGIFRNVMAKRGLPDEITAIQDVLKGKLTTVPSFHSGEGIFWTSKIADRLVISSYDYRLTVDSLMGDYAVEKLDEGEEVLGTEVYFEIAEDTDKSLVRLFREFSFDKESLTLDTTVIPVELYKEGEVWISRSQAKKVLAGLEKFKKIIFDFKGIKMVGQGFADEIFRVFNIQHPEIVLEAVNMNESVRLMVEHARNDQTGRG